MTQKIVGANPIWYSDQPFDVSDDLKDTFPKLEDQAETSTTCRVHPQIGVRFGEMFPRLVRVDTASGISFTDEDVLTAQMGSRIERCSVFIVRCASNTPV